MTSKIFLIHSGCRSKQIDHYLRIVYSHIRQLPTIQTACYEKYNNVLKIIRNICRGTRRGGETFSAVLQIRSSSSNAARQQAAATGSSSLIIIFFISMRRCLNISHYTRKDYILIKVRSEQNDGEEHLEFLFIKDC